MNDTKLTPKQTQILLLLYKFRFLHTYQLQHLLNHKNSNRIKVWLKELTEKEYLKRDYIQNTMIKKPAIYSLTIKSRELLKTRKECEIVVLNKIYREKTRSITFVDHCILIADIFLILQAQTLEKFYFATKNNLTGYDYFPSPLPDAYIVFKKSQKIERYFLEVIDDNLPRFALRGKIQRYIDYYQSEKWEEHTEKQFPSILIICPTEVSKRYTERFIITTFTAEQVTIRFKIVTKEEIQKKAVY
jgi:hypothetical protein